MRSRANEAHIPVEYVVQAGETLASISLNYGAPLPLLLESNLELGLGSDDLLPDGTSLTRPNSGPQRGSSFPGQRRTRRTTGQTAPLLWGCAHRRSAWQRPGSRGRPAARSADAGLPAHRRAAEDACPSRPALPLLPPWQMRPGCAARPIRTPSIILDPTGPSTCRSTSTSKRSRNSLRRCRSTWKPGAGPAGTWFSWACITTWSVARAARSPGRQRPPSSKRSITPTWANRSSPLTSTSPAVSPRSPASFTGTPPSPTQTT